VGAGTAPGYTRAASQDGGRLLNSSTFRSRVAPALLSVVLILGITAAARLVRHHEIQVYGDATASLGNCPQTETINCEVVNTSAWSELFGVPIAAFAVPTYLLVLGLVLLGRRTEALWSYAFCIGLLTVIYSAFLLWVSSTRIGYFCLWCMGLYAVNLAIPMLAGVAAGRSPRSLVRLTMSHLATWPSPLRRTATAFGLLLVGTLVIQQAYRHEVRQAAAEARARIEEQGGPLLPAVPLESATPGVTPAPDRKDRDPAAKGHGRSARLGLPRPDREAGPLLIASILPLGAGFTAAAAAPPSGGAYHLTGPLRRLSGSSQKLVAEPFDLQGRLGRGRPTALLFWAPEFPDSERELVTLAGFLARETPQIEVYAVSGRRDDQQDDEIWERFSMLKVPPSLPLLVDDRFVLSQALTTVDVPDLTLFDGKGALVVAKIKDLTQMLLSTEGRVTAETVLLKIASGAPIQQIKNMYPFYPSADLVGRCAPAFTAKKFGSPDSYTFTGRSPAGKPTLVMFWSSTCKHCQKEIPQMVEWIRKNPGVVDVVSVTHLKTAGGSDAAHRKTTEDYIRAQHIPWLVLEDPDDAVADLYRSISTPTTYVVSPSSRVVDIWYYAHSGNYGQALETALAKTRAATSCEAPAPESAARLGFSIMAEDGKRVTLASLLDRPALVHFWATWCAPCVAELPSLLRLRDKVEKTGAARVVLVSVEGEEAGARIAEFQKKLGLDLRSFRAPSGGLAERVDLGHRVPRTYLVAPDGEVLALRQGSQNWDDPALIARVRSRLEVLGNNAQPGSAHAAH
jgi:cytochrome c biogenesis protein CcmG/thiol:disulfide interchange protein DsbE